MFRWLSLLVTMSALAGAARAESDAGPPFVWSRLPDLPEAAASMGPFAGVSNGGLIVAGGMDAAGGSSDATDAIYVLDSPDGHWRKVEARLPVALGHGVSISTSLPTAHGLLCLGGKDGQRHYGEVWLLHWNGKTVEITSLPSLPTPTASACGAIVGSTIYVAGALERPSFWGLDLDRPKEQWRWETLPPWPGAARKNAVAGVQSGSFFLIGGATPQQAELTDAYRYAPGKGWRPIAATPRPTVGAPSPAAPLGQSHLALLTADLLAYHTITDTWRSLGEAPAGSGGSTAFWAGGFVTLGGEIAGMPSSAVDLAGLVERRAVFGLANYCTLMVYLAGIVGLGCWFSRRNKTTNDFFRGGQRVPWWAAGISIYATMVSSISYMAIPAKAYATDWSYYGLVIAILLVQPLVIWFYLPVFRQLDVTSAYEYLERRFNLAVRWFGSLSFIVLQVGRLAIVLYLPALALATVSSFDIYACIILMGTLCILYTMLGGMEAVIWTDVVQTVVLLGGVLGALLVIVCATKGGLPQILDTAHANDKLLENLDWSWDLTAGTVWVILLGNILSNLAPYTASQDVVQRYITTKDARQAKRAIWTNAVMTPPFSTAFFFVGTALFAFYKSHPDRLDPMMQTDSIFPLFIVRELPAGMGGLVVAGIFAAAQSTLSGGLNSIATCWVTDFHHRLKPAASDRANLWMARLITLTVGIAVTAMACVMATLNVVSLWDAFISILNLTGSALAGLFALGLFTRRANGRGALVGAIASIPILYYVQQYTPMHFFLYAGVGIVSCFVIGWVASGAFGPPVADLAGLTIYTRRKEDSR